MTVDLTTKINEFVKANRKVWPERPKEEKPKRRNPKHRHRDQVYWVEERQFGSYRGHTTHTMVLLCDNELLEIDNIMYIEPYEAYVTDCWDDHYDRAGKPGEGVRLYEVTAKEARRLWQGRLCTDKSPDDEDW